MDTLIYKITSDIDKLSKDVVQLLRQSGGNGKNEAANMLVTAESCTGGLLSGAITSVSGSSEVFGLGLCTYSNEAKVKYLNVSSETLGKYGAVSVQTALEMAHGAANAARFTNKANITAVSVTGIAGPEGGSDEKPVGTVYFACVTEYENLKAEKTLHLRIDAAYAAESSCRKYIRLESVRQALILVKDTILIHNKG